MTKFVVKAILLFEDAIAELTIDRASSNKIRQLSNYFWNSFNVKYKVFVFSDSPYLIKIIQNCLCNKQILRGKLFNFK